ncbi:MAG: IS66 family transposase [Solirubrobacteraceae bacterium MAG38_C4-C5]|nr:IS66 family transposase [Candidatus Siliceabacter maunaloa]
MRRDEIDSVYRAGPDAVAALIAAQAEQIAVLRAEVDELKRQLGRDSRNSSLPPSRDSPASRAKRAKKEGSGRRQGGQPGHRASHREMVADPDEVVEHWPGSCAGCGGRLTVAGREQAGDAVCHQVTDIDVRVLVTEHRRIRARCGCGHHTLAGLPAGVAAGAFGPSVAAAAATLTAARMSRRDSARLLDDLCGVQICPASVERLAKACADTLEDPYMQIMAAVDHSVVRGADETSFRQGAQTTWLSVAAAPQAALFQLDARRDRDAAKALLGETPTGTIVSDRYAVYRYIPDDQRQLCLAHLLRDFTALGERAGAPGKLGRKLARAVSEVFAVLNQPDRDPRDLPALRADLADTRQTLHDLLTSGARCRDARTRRFCQGLLDCQDALWTFTRLPDIPATNNTAERALRHAVLWRKTSYGTQTDHGNRLVERLLSVRETCRLQGRRLHHYLTTAITADLHGQPVIAPLPP